MEALRRFVKRRQAGQYCEIVQPGVGGRARAPGRTRGSSPDVLLRRVCGAVPDHGKGRSTRRDAAGFVEAVLFELKLDDAQWSSLDVPVELVFFCHVTTAGRVVAQYPSPAGAMESLLNLDGWRGRRGGTIPSSTSLQPDVEAALLVNRTRQAQDYYAAMPIDQCYRLIVRSIRKSIGRASRRAPKCKPRSNNSLPSSAARPMQEVALMPFCRAIESPARLSSCTQEPAASEAVSG